MHGMTVKKKIKADYNVSEATVLIKITYHLRHYIKKNTTPERERCTTSK